MRSIDTSDISIGLAISSPLLLLIIKRGFFTALQGQEEFSHLLKEARPHSHINLAISPHAQVCFLQLMIIMSWKYSKSNCEEIMFHVHVVEAFDTLI